MIKRTLYFGNPAYLSLKMDQLVVSKPGADGSKSEQVKTVPIEDIGVVVFDNKQLTYTQALVEKLLDNSCAIILAYAGRNDAAVERSYSPERTLYPSDRSISSDKETDLAANCSGKDCQSGCCAEVCYGKGAR